MECPLVDPDRVDQISVHLPVFLRIEWMELLYAQNPDVVPGGEDDGQFHRLAFRPGGFRILQRLRATRTVPMPVRTTSPAGLVTRPLSFTISPFSFGLCVTSTTSHTNSRRSPGRTGPAKRRVNSSPREAPRFEKWVAVIPRNREAVCGPQAMIPPKRVVFANSSSWCRGLKSPASLANSAISSLLNRASSVMRSPTLTRSPKVYLPFASWFHRIGSRRTMPVICRKRIKSGGAGNHRGKGRPATEQRPLGSGGLTVSRMGLGCMGMSEFYGPGDEKESIR